MESPKSLFLRIQIGLDTLFIEGEPYGNPVGREQAHDTKGSDPSSGIPAEVDDEAVDLSQPLNGTRDFVGYFDSNHPWEHRDLQVAQSVFEMPCLNQLRLDEMKLLSLGQCHIDWDGAPMIVSADNLQAGLLAHHEDRVLWRGDFAAIHAEKNVT